MKYEIENHSTNGWYIHNYDKRWLYLHVDGRWCDSLINEYGVYTGLYASKEKAETILNMYKPKITMKDLRPGNRFKCHGFNGTDDVMLVMDFAFLKPIHHIARLVYIRENDPTTLHWVNVESVDSEVEIL